MIVSIIDMKFTVQFALLSNKYQQQEYAQSLLENILTSHPTRVDIWFQYVDMLIKDKLYDFARYVFKSIYTFSNKKSIK